MANHTGVPERQSRLYFLQIEFDLSNNLGSLVLKIHGVKSVETIEEEDVLDNPRENYHGIEPVE